MRWFGKTSALLVLDLKASSLCIEDVDVGALDHGAVIKGCVVSMYLITGGL